MYNQGISYEGDLIDLGVVHKIVQKSGSWFSFGETRLGQGRERVKEFLKERKDLAEEIERLLIEKLNPEEDEIVEEKDTK